MKGRTVAWSVIVAVFIMFASAPMVAAQSAQKGGGGGGGGQAAQWVIMTYVIDDGCSTPVPLPVTKLKGGDVSFDMGPTPCSPDRAMLLTEKFPKGTLTGHSLSARFALIAPDGTTFSYWDNDLGPTPGGFVRLYIQGRNPALTGCEPGWHPLRPDCEAQYWWSNPLHIDLADLALLGKKGTTLQAILSPEFWSDRDGHMGSDPIWTDPDSGITVDHAAAFYAAVNNATRMGLSFGGGGSWAFGVGSDPSSTFVLNKFETRKQ